MQIRNKEKLLLYATLNLIYEKVPDTFLPRTFFAESIIGLANLLIYVFTYRFCTNVTMYLSSVPYSLTEPIIMPVTKYFCKNG